MFWLSRLESITSLLNSLVLSSIAKLLLILAISSSIFFCANLAAVWSSKIFFKVTFSAIDFLAPAITSFCALIAFLSLEVANVSLANDITLLSRASSSTYTFLSLSVLSLRISFSAAILRAKIPWFSIPTIEEIEKELGTKE